MNKKPDHSASKGLSKGDFLRLKTEFSLMKRAADEVVTPLAIFRFMKAPDQLTRLGIVVSRKYDKHAVQRNRARRLIRESFRLLKHQITEPTWLLVISRQHLHGKTLNDLKTEMKDTLLQAGVFEESE